MGRPHRAAEGGYVYHVVNRANARLKIFEDERDYGAFEKVLTAAVERTRTRLLAQLPQHGFINRILENNLHPFLT